MNVTNLARNLINGSRNVAFQELINKHTAGVDGSSKSEALSRLKNSLNMLPKDVRNATEARITRFSTEITKYLYPDNTFVKKSVNDAAFAASGETTTTAEAVDGPIVTKGRVYAKSLLNGDNAPVATVKVRKNNKKDWTMEYFHTEPTVLSGSETSAEVAYNARQDQLLAHSEVLDLATSNFTAVEWSQGEVGVADTVDTVQGKDNHYVFTSGAARLNAVEGATGNVKAISVNDMIAAKSALNRQLITKGVGGAEVLYFLPTDEQYSDLLKLDKFVDYDKTGQNSKLEKGEVGKIMNITVLNPRIRKDWNANALYSYTALAVTSTDLTKIEDTALSGASMVSAGLIWSDKHVRRAEGSAIVFPWMNSPLYYGDLFAVEQRFTADKKRSTGDGVVMLVENPF